MIENGFNKLSWGFLFIVLDFKICGFDIFPDVIGFILFAMAFSQLKEHSQHFSKASTLNIFTLLLSIFSIYKVQSSNSSIINYGILGSFSIFVGIPYFILTLLVIYNLLMGMKEMLISNNKNSLAMEADERWTRFITLIIASILGGLLLFIPVLGVIYILGLLIFSIVFLVKTMQYFSSCKKSFNEYNY